MSAGDAQTWFIAGTIVAMVAGSMHALTALVDTVRPTSFAPIESSVKAAMEGTGMQMVRRWGGSDARPSMWSVWLGVNIALGLGILTFGLFCLLIAIHDFKLVERIDAIQPLTIAYPAANLAVSLRFWFTLPTLATATATACFTVATVLPA